jgi:uncharacterized protein YkwD
MKRSITLFALLLGILGLLAGAGNAATNAPSTTVRPQALDREILVRLNATRSARGLRPLTFSRDLRDAAVAHSRAMLDGGFFTHASKDGSSFALRVRTFYPAAGFETWSIGENLLSSSGGEIDAPAAIEAWLASPTHRENMLNPAWREVGIASLHASAAGGTFGGEPTWVITMDFGARTGKTAIPKI